MYSLLELTFPTLITSPTTPLPIQVKTYMHFNKGISAPGLLLSSVVYYSESPKIIKALSIAIHRRNDGNVLIVHYFPPRNQEGGIVYRVIYIRGYLVDSSGQTATGEREGTIWDCRIDVNTILILRISQM